MMRFFRSRLFWRFFFSYFVLILVSLVVLGLFIHLSLPGAFEGRSSAMAVLFSEYGVEGESHMMGGRFRRNMTGSGLFLGLFRIFDQVILQAILQAALVAFIVALVISILISRQFVRPLQQMTDAADLIAEGNLNIRLPVDAGESKVPKDEMGLLAVRFNRMTMRLEEAEKLRQQLITDVSHELRTPLTVIKGSMEGLVDDVLAADQKTFEAIYRQADRLERLLEDLQELSRIEGGGLKYHVVPIELSEFIEDILASVRMAFDNRGVKLFHHRSPDPCMVLADKDRLGQVMINLLNNALQYTPPGEQVSVSYLQEDGEVTVSVRDTGIGISQEHLPYVFQRFYRVDPSRARQAGGSGIGLTIAKKLVEAHGGRIWVESDGPGQGSVFRFTLSSHPGDSTT